MATAYCTLYGDMAGGFAVVKGLLKTTVFALARTAPRPDRSGQPPPYEVLDGI